MFSFAIAPTENVEVEIFGSQDGVNFGENNLSKFQILTYSLNTRFIRSFSFNAINYIRLKVKVPHVADIKLTGVKEKDISPNLEIQNNLLANLPPTSTDDFSKGYVVGSLWVDNNEKITYVCVDNTVDNSVWAMVKMPDHEINGSQVRFKNPDGSWGSWIVLGGTVLDIENSQIKLKDTADNVLSTININTDLINDTTNNRFVTDSDINRWNDTYTTSTIDSSLNTKVNKSGDVMTGELGLPSYKLGNSNVFYVGGSEIVTMRNWGAELSTIFSIRALPPKSWKDGEGADFTNVDREATLALIRTDDAGNEEFIDIYNNGYNSSTNDDAVQYGIRIQKRGIGEYRDFVFDRSDGNLKEPIWKIKTDKTMEFYEPLSIQGGISDLSGRSLSKNDFTDTLLNKLNGIEDNANNYTLETHDNAKHTVDYAKQTDVINNFSLSVPEGAIAYFTNSLIDNINGIKPEGYDITAGINRIEAINYGNTGSYNKIQIDGIDALTGSEIVEEGSNANGNYIKYENGVIIEYTSLNLIGGDAPGGIDKYQNVWTFPSMFANNNYIVSGTILGYLGTDSKGLWSMLRCLYDNSSFANIVVHLSDNILVSGDTLTCYLLAIGRWK
jgi:hypothetical protein